MRIILFTIGGILVVLLIGGNVFLYMEGRKTESKLTQERTVSQKWQEQYDQMKTGKLAVEQSNEKLRADVIVYLDSNNQLKAENQNVNADLVLLVENLKAKDARIGELEEFLESGPRAPAGEQQPLDDTQREKIKSEIKGLENEIYALEDLILEERGIYHYNLGVAYSRAKMYKQAIKAYKKSLEYNAYNAEANYNLGLMHKESQQAPEKAVFYFKKYLELQPNAKDKKEVEAWADALKTELLSL